MAPPAAGEEDLLLPGGAACRPPGAGRSSTPPPRAAHPVRAGAGAKLPCGAVRGKACAHRSSTRRGDPGKPRQARGEAKVVETTAGLPCLRSFLGWRQFSAQ